MIEQRMLFVHLLFWFILPLTALHAQSPGEWAQRAALPTPRQEMPLVTLQGRLVVAGGFLESRAATNLIEVFDPATNAWSTIPPLPMAMNHLQAAVVEDKLYVLGGYVGSTFTPTDEVFEYDPASNQWTMKARMPSARGAAMTGVMDGKIYVIGGEPGRRENDVYDPAADEWTSGARMPTGREHLAGAAIDSLIYVVGGRGGGMNHGALEAYAPQSDIWYTLADMPTARGGLAATAFDGKLYVFGGEFFGATSGVFEETEEYDPTTNTWRTLEPMPHPRHGMGAVTVRDSIFIIGGGPVAGFGVTDVNSIFIPPSVVTTVTDEQTLPDGFTLKQNYPNPFNPTTTIEFALPQTSEMVLRIYNLRGEVVNTLIQGTHSAGVQSVTWDGTDHLGRSVTSGLYFYKLDVGTFTEIRKMTFLK